MKTRFAIFTLILILFPASFVFAQDSKVQQLVGGYDGVVGLGLRTGPAEAQLTIDAQDSRRFIGTLAYIEQDNLLVAGTIAASGKCSLGSLPDEPKSNVNLLWENFGGGAAVLTGSLTGTVDDTKTSGPVAFLRPFDDLAVDWSGTVGSHTAILESAVDGRQAIVPVDILAGVQGALQARFDGWTNPEPDPVVIGTSSSGLGFVAAGVSDSTGELFVIDARVVVDARGLPTEITGTYAVQAINGKTTDTGIIAILIGIF